PAEGEFTSDYGPRDYEPSPFHAGVDIANDIGTPVYAALAGTVIGVGANLAPGRSGDRNVLIESSDGQGQYYGHLNSNSVSVGDTVTSGQHIAEMGARGNVTGPHLHFETWADANDPGSHYDPVQLFNEYGVSVGDPPLLLRRKNRSRTIRTIRSTRTMPR